MIISFPEQLELALKPTPLEPLERLSAEFKGVRIWVKRDDMTGSATSGNKVRKLEYTLAKAKREGADTLITCGGLQSNHCRATALLGARLGMNVHLILRGTESATVPEGNLFLDHLSGAQISCYDVAKYRQSLPQLITHWRDHYRSRGRQVYCIPTGASDAVGVWGYVECARELAVQIAQRQMAVSAIIHATGSGGTQAGLTAGAFIYNLGASVVGMAVCDSAAYFQRKVRADLKAWQQDYQTGVDTDALAIHVNDAYIGPGYAQAGPEVFATIRKVAALEGLVLDPVYTGKAFHGMLCELQKGAYQGDVLFVHTGGIFGLMAQRQQAL